MASKLLRTRDIQPPDDALRRQAEDAEADVQQAVSDALDEFAAGVDQDKIESALEQGAYGAIILAINFPRLRSLLTGALGKLRLVYDAGMDAGAERLADAGINFGTPVAMHGADLAEATDRLVRTISAGSEEAIAQAIRDGVTRSLGLDEIAANIRDSIGLSARQAQAVANYRSALEEGDLSALDRALRDRRFDRAITAAVDAAVPIDTSKIDEAVAAYAQRQLDYRAMMIARTEVLRLTNRGAANTYTDAIARGILSFNQVRRFWLIAPDEITCVVCRSIPEMNPDGVAVGQPYMSIDGPQMYPQDPHPLCRCSESVEILRIAMPLAA